MKPYHLLPLLAGLCLHAAHIHAQPPKLAEDNVGAIVSAMTLEEKAHLLVGTNLKSDGVRAGGTTYPVERLGIPPIVLADGPAGLRISPRREGDERTFYCTGFPIGMLLSSTWDDDAVRRVGASICNATRSAAATSSTTPRTRCCRV